MVKSPPVFSAAISAIRSMPLVKARDGPCTDQFQETFSAA